MRTRTFIGFAAATLFTLLACGAARADDYAFSFSNDPTGPGNVAGTVTGEIYGLPTNGTGAATDITITSYPAGLVKFGSYTTPVDVFSWTGATIVENSFTVTGGVITGGGFEIDGGNGLDDQLYLSSDCGDCNTFGLGTGTNFIDIGNGDKYYVWNDNGIGATGVVYSEVATVTPEPGTLLLLGSGLLSLGGRLWKRAKR